MSKNTTKIASEPKASTKGATKGKAKVEAKAKREVHSVSEGGTFDRDKLKTNWSAKQVKEARAKHHKVKVGNKLYRSVYTAFVDLSLPLWQHQSFRKVLKLSKGGRETFEFKGKKIPFEIAK